MSLVNFLMMMGNASQASAPLPAQISNVVATKPSDGTGCGSTLGVQYSVTWTPNASVNNTLHDVKITITGGTGSPSATRATPQSIPSVTVISNDANDAGGTNATYTLTYELIETAGPTTIQTGTVTGNPDSTIFDINSSCIV